LPQVFVQHRRVEFRDTDAAGIAHFSVFFTWMEEVEHAFLREQGLGVHNTSGSSTISWPRVSASCDYRRPAKFEDQFDVRLTVKKLGNRSVTYGFVFQRGPDTLAEGLLVAACCRMDAGHAPQAIELPTEFVRALQPFVE
jgi:4-hydroxybenzoyl-CoA thioesterase/acyl-CoA thioester hydrolase